MKYDEAARRLRRLGCEEVTRRHAGGSHRRWRNPASGEERPIPDWGSKDLKEGTLRGILKGLELDWDEFMRKK